MENQNVFSGQLEYKTKIESKGLKKGFIADALGINKAIFSQFINGRLYMPEAVKLKLDKYLDN